MISAKKSQKKKISDEHGLSQEDKLFLKKVEQKIKKVEGHYEILLPFREDEVVMPDNRAQAERRAHWIKKKFLKNNRLRKQYACQRICKESSTKRYSPEERQSMAAPRMQ